MPRTLTETNMRVSRAHQKINRDWFINLNDLSNANARTICIYRSSSWHGINRKSKMQTLTGRRMRRRRRRRRKRRLHLGMATGPLRATTIFIVILNLSVYITILALAGWAVDTSIDGNPTQGNSIPHLLFVDGYLIQISFHWWICLFHYISWIN